MQLWGITRLAIEVVLSAIYVRDVFPKLKAGGPRLLASLPIIAVNISIPYYFNRSEQFIRRGCCLLILTWLSNFKVCPYRPARDHETRCARSKSPYSCAVCLMRQVPLQTLGFAINRGPLCQPLTPFQFLLVYALPITPQSSGENYFQETLLSSGTSHLLNRPALSIARHPPTSEEVQQSAQPVSRQQQVTRTQVCHQAPHAEWLRLCHGLLPASVSGG